VHATDIIQALAHASATRPDVIVLPLALANHLGAAAIAALGSDSAFRHVATIIVVPKRDSATIAACEAFHVTDCLLRWSEESAATVFATSFAKQEQRIWKVRVDTTTPSKNEEEPSNVFRLIGRGSPGP
jgi:DNA-binding NarL/FixJ family response regulator